MVYIGSPQSTDKKSAKRLGLIRKPPKKRRQGGYFKAGVVIKPQIVKRAHPIVQVYYNQPILCRVFGRISFRPTVFLQEPLFVPSAP